MRSKTKRVLLRAYSVAVLVFFLVVLVHDAVAHVVAPLRTGCGVEVYDVYGLLKTPPQGTCYFKGLSTWGFRSLGKTTARKIIIITHFFSTPPVVGLGVSDEDSVWFALTHPVSLFFILKGIASGKTYLAVSPGILSISSRLDGKVIVIISCKLPGMKEFADALLRSGAKLVAVSNAEALSKDNVGTFLNVALTTKNLCGSSLFVCYNHSNS